MIARGIHANSGPVGVPVKSNPPAARSAFSSLLSNQIASAAADTTAVPQKSGLAVLATPTPSTSIPAASTTSANTSTPANAAVTPWTPANSTGPHSAPSAQDLFGAHPWLENPTGFGPNGITWSYNPAYFATRQTAETVANMVGGTVVEQKQICPTGPLQQSQPNEMVQLANGKMINAGLFADMFTHGYPQYYVDKMVQQEIDGA